MNEKFVIYEGYKVFENGDIYSKKGKKIHVKDDGYIFLNIYHNANEKPRRRIIRAARFVIEAFQGKKLSQFFVVENIDGNPKNNALKNLKVTARSDYYLNNHIVEKTFDTKTQKKIIKEYKNYKVDKKSGLSQKALADKYGCSQSTIRKIIYNLY